MAGALYPYVSNPLLKRFGRYIKDQASEFAANPYQYVQESARAALPPDPLGGYNEKGVPQANPLMAKWLADNVGFSAMTNWHGTGARFNQFDDAFMGSGEGAQAFGWGHYTADRKGIANDYFKKLNQPKATATFDGNPLDIKKRNHKFSDDIRTNLSLNQTLGEWASGRYDKNIKTFADAIRNERKLSLQFARDARKIDREIARKEATLTRGADKIYAELLDDQAQYRHLARSLKPYEKRVGGELIRDTGSLMKVDIPDDEVARMLVQDLPMSEQPKNVQRAIRKLAGVTGTENMYARLLRELPKDDRRWLHENVKRGMSDSWDLSTFMNEPKRVIRWAKAIQKAQHRANPVASRLYVENGTLLNNMFGNARMTGSQAYRQLQRDMGVTLPLDANKAKAASQALKDAGVPGMRFADAASRYDINPRSPDATFNTISFDPRLIRILEINGEATGMQPWQPGEYRNMLLDAMRK